MNSSSTLLINSLRVFREKHCLIKMQNFSPIIISLLVFWKIRIEASTDKSMDHYSLGIILRNLLENLVKFLLIFPFDGVMNIDIWSFCCLCNDLSVCLSVSDEILKQKLYNIMYVIQVNSDVTGVWGRAFGV